MSQAAEIRDREMVALGYTKPAEPMMGHGHRDRSVLVHHVRWWKPPGAQSSQGQAVWFCNGVCNGGYSNTGPHIVTEVPKGMEMCQRCEDRAEEVIDKDP